MKKLSITFLLLAGLAFVRADGKFILADVSMKDVFEDCHIKGAENVPFSKIIRYTKKFDKDDEIVFYCTNYRCISAREACKMFQAKGFNNVAVYEGGVAEWYQLNKEGKDFITEGPGKMPFLSQKLTPVENEDKNIKIIEANQLKEKLVENVYNRKVGFMDKIFDAIESTKSFFSDLFGLN